MQLAKNSLVHLTLLDVEDYPGYPIPIIALGEGPKKLLSTYGIHGDEPASVLAFTQTPQQLLEEFGDTLKQVQYIGMLLNPRGVSEGTREHCIDEIHECDLNRDWTYFEDPFSRAAKDYIDGVVNSAGPENIFHCCHHENMMDGSPYFYVSSSFYRFNPKSGKRIGKAIYSFTEKVIAGLEKESIGVAKRSILAEYLERLADAVFGEGDPDIARNPFNTKPYELDKDSTLSNYLTKKEVASIIFESPIQARYSPFISQLTPWHVIFEILSKKLSFLERDIVERRDMHTLVDEILFENLKN